MSTDFELNCEYVVDTEKNRLVGVEPMGPRPPTGRGVSRGRSSELPLLLVPGVRPSEEFLQDKGRDGGRFTQIRVNAPLLSLCAFKTTEKSN